MLVYLKFILIVLLLRFYEDQIVESDVIRITGQSQVLSNDIVTSGYFDTEGLYRDFSDKSSLIRRISIPEAKELIASGSLTGGMLPKLTNCIQAMENGVNRVHILDGRVLHSLLLEIFTNKGIGTAILADDAERYFVE